ncbi:aminoacyl tRNA synthase complex-interacting multifunctional protein 1 [Pieris napi]|uniref:aminoacyl tRNA synthase complex-interacting multifunctional protein 1 n=1 Tax=Pieris napi TaxID=78633 RepID=UPI001FBA9335|nr:aminoacyl tRNA synthase complex-interacting multifunctional protein 1 [Pieris napi]
MKGSYFKSIRIIIRNMSHNHSTVINNAEIAENRLADLRKKLDEVRNFKIQEEINSLIKENNALSSKVVKAKLELIKLETQQGKKQYQLPDKTVLTSEALLVSSSTLEAIPQETKKAKKEPAKKKEKTENASSSVDSVVDIRKLDLRIGKIIGINKHPDADSLYVEKIDCGENIPRTVVSGLVNHVPIDDMRDRIVMVLCNLKPVKMRGVTSEAMVMCASSPEKVEVLIPPAGAIPGDLVSCEGYPREPEPQLNPKKKIFETCAPDLKTDDKKIACYKGSPLVVPGKGPVVAATLHGVSVK